MTTYTCPDGHSSQSGDYCDVCGAPIGAAGSAPAAPAAAGPAAAPAAPSSSLSLDPAVPPPLPATGAAGAASNARVCPNCSASNPPGALFCEDCGYDFTTGQLPRPLDPPPGAAAPVPADANAVLDAAAAPSTNPAGVPAAPPATTAPPASSGNPVAFVAELWVDPDWYAAQDVTDPCPSAGMPVVVPIRGTSVLVGRTSASRNIHPEIDVTADTGVSRRHAQLTTDGQRWWVEDLQSANGTFVGVAGDPLPTTAIAPGQRVELPDEGRVYLGAWTRLVVRKASPSEQTP